MQEINNWFLVKSMEKTPIYIIRPIVHYSFLQIFKTHFLKINILVNNLINQFLFFYQKTMKKIAYFSIFHTVEESNDDLKLLEYNI